MNESEPNFVEICLNVLQKIDFRELEIPPFKFIKIDNNTVQIKKEKKMLQISYAENVYTLTKVEGVYAENLQALIEDFFPDFTCAMICQASKKGG